MQKYTFLRTWRKIFSEALDNFNKQETKRFPTSPAGNLTKKIKSTYDTSNTIITVF